MKKSCEFQWFHFTHQCQHFYDRNRNNRFKCLLIEIIQMGRHLKRVDKSNIEAGTSWIDPWLVTSLLQSFSCGNPSSVTDLLFFFSFYCNTNSEEGKLPTICPRLVGFSLLCSTGKGQTKKIYLPPKCMKAQVSCAGGVSHPRRFRWGVTINLFQVPFKKRAHWPTIFLVRKHKFGPRVVTGLHAVAAIWPAFNTGRYFIGRTTGINANSDTFLGQE